MDEGVSGKHSETRLPLSTRGCAYKKALIVDQTTDGNGSAAAIVPANPHSPNSTC